MRHRDDAETNYRAAHNRAVAYANETGLTMQLRAEKEYGQVVYVVGIAVQDPAKRFGVDGRGEFIAPGTPRMRSEIV